MTLHAANEIVPEDGRRSQQPDLGLALHRATLCTAGTVEGDTALAVLINAIGRADPSNPWRLPAARYAVKATKPESPAENEAIMRFDHAVTALGKRQAASQRVVAANWLGNAYEAAAEGQGADSPAAMQLHRKLARNVFGATAFLQP